MLQLALDGEFSGAIEMVWQKNKTNTLEADADEIELTDIGLFDFNDILLHILSMTDVGSAGPNIRLRLNNIVQLIYIIRRAINGNNDSVFESNFIALENNQSPQDRLIIMDAINIANRAKAMISIYTASGSPGAGNVPNRGQEVAKMDTRVFAGQFTSTQFYNSNAIASSYAIGSNLSLLSTD